MDRYTAVCSTRDEILTRLMRFQSIYGFTLFPSTRGSPPPEVSLLHEICGIVDGCAAVCSFLRPRLGPPPDGLLSSLSAILSPPRQSLLAETDEKIIDGYAPMCSGRNGFLTRLMTFQIRLLPAPSSRGRSPPEATFLLNIYSN